MKRTVRVLPTCVIQMSSLAARILVSALQVDVHMADGALYEFCSPDGFVSYEERSPRKKHFLGGFLYFLLFATTEVGNF